MEKIHGAKFLTSNGQPELKELSNTTTTFAFFSSSSLCLSPSAEKARGPAISLHSIDVTDSHALGI